MTIRNEKIDMLKGIAIILVVMGHSMSDMEYLKIPFNIIYSFHMPMMFFLSGYLLESTKAKYKLRGTSFLIVHKMETILIPYVTWTVFVPWLRSGFDTGILLDSLLGVTGIYGGGIWFLPVLFGLTLVYALIWRMQDIIYKDKESFVKDVILLLISIILLILLVVLTKYPYLTNMLSYAIPFFFGIFTAKYSWINRIVEMKWTIICSLILYILIFPYFDFYNTDMMTQVKRIVLSVFAIIVLWNCFENKVYKNAFYKFLMLCGKYSLAIYLIHGYLSKWKLILQEFDSVILGNCLSFIGSCIICLLCIAGAKLLEKNKITAKLFLGK